MKNHKTIIRVLGLVCICAILVGAPASMLAKSGGHLIVNRAANFGENISLSVLVDGKEVGNLGEGQNYDGYLKPGQHVLSATIVPNVGASAAWTKSMEIK